VGQAQREEILLSPEERETVLFRMRELLKDVSIILEVTLTSDFGQVAKAGRDAGLQGGAHMPPSVQPKLPLAFRQLAQATHRAFDNIAAQAERTRDPDPILRMLSANLQRCVACHAAYGVRSDSSK
jgi:hypothetical protein